ncbi:MAG: hypothetical protein HZB46_19080 [Solirubrobacterales bacterium]|nr:hypothetical protein [Solirubrobacterales bacterium]
MVVTLPDGTRFTLTGERAVPFGARVDARKGRVRITADDGRGGTYSAVFYDGVFVPSQRGTKARVIIELRLVEDVGLASCPAPRKAAAARKKKPPRKRRLWGDGKGSFSIKGRHSAATARGTLWLVQDSCAGTLTQVRRGVVEVRDFTRRRTVRVQAGQRYVAKPPRRRR